MRGTGPCCTRFETDGAASWKEVLAAVAGTAGVLEPPPQLLEGFTTVIDLGNNPPSEVGRVYTYVDASTATWTEHWVTQAADLFSNGARQTRLDFPRPQPQERPWSQLEPQFSGWWHAAVVYQYVAPPPPNQAPQLPPGTFVFQVRCSGADTPLQGGLFRTVTGSVVQDRWVLFPGYIRPNRRSVTDLIPAVGDPQQLFHQALITGGPMSEYVDVTYTVAVLP